ncbi:MAG: PepSY domain-containing protein, partial [Gammaproteobacteria bacterium]
SNGRERFWNWLGSTVHWIYPVQLRQHRQLWIDVIVYLSLIGLVSIVTGTIIGIMRLRFRNPYRGKDISPYKGMMKWHHVLGLFTVLFVFTFTFSGLMSMGPWGIFDSATSAQPQIMRYTGQDYLRLTSLPSVDQIPGATNGNVIKEVSWHYVNSEPYLLVTRVGGEQSVQFADSKGNDAMHLLGHIMESIPRLLPEARLLEIDMLREYDDYYYARHNTYRPLPVYRARFDDPESTWYHIDIDTGEPVSRVTDASRLERWLFNGLHSLDFQWLWRQRPLWDITVIVLSLLGLGFSATGVVVGWRYLRGRGQAFKPDAAV